MAENAEYAAFFMQLVVVEGKGAYINLMVWVFLQERYCLCL
jgi:hypothetical protein